MSSSGVSFRDASFLSNLAHTWKSLTGNYLSATPSLACPVLSIRAEQQVAPNQSENSMKKDRKEIASSEPIGIVISRGDKTEPTPVFSAYIWGPVPDAAQDSATRAA